MNRDLSARGDAEARARRAAALARDPLGWFDPLYAGARAERDPCRVPWVDLETNRFLSQWLERENPQPDPECVVVVGCGLGDDAEELAGRGFAVTAFDFSPTAIDWCRERFPETRVDYRVADLFALPAEWRRRFGLVVEVYTVQALPLELRRRAMRAVAELVAPGGRLLVVAHLRADAVTRPSGPPWPLSRVECREFMAAGLVEESVEVLADPDETHPRRERVRLVLRR
jgi:SAM-dependent methyltransferase